MTMVKECVQAHNERVAKIKAVAPKKRKFNLMLGLKRNWWLINDYFGIYTKGDKIWFWGTYTFCLLVLFTVVIPVHLQLIHMQ